MLLNKNHKKKIFTTDMMDADIEHLFNNRNRNFSQKGLDEYIVKYYNEYKKAHNLK